jgi:hypothetical protein
MGVAWERRGMHAASFSEKLRGRDHLGDLSIDGIII